MPLDVLHRAEVEEVQPDITRTSCQHISYETRRLYIDQHNRFVHKRKLSELKLLNMYIIFLTTSHWKEISSSLPKLHANLTWNVVMTWLAQLVWMPRLHMSDYNALISNRISQRLDETQHKVRITDSNKSLMNKSSHNSIMQNRF